jgi:hypothetical protein
MEGFDDDGLMLDANPPPPQNTASRASSTPMSAEEQAMKEQLSKIVMPSAVRPDFALSAATGRPTECVFSLNGSSP